MVSFTAIVWAILTAYSIPPSVLANLVLNSIDQTRLSVPPNLEAVPGSDPAGYPNLATRLEVTSEEHGHLDCGQENDTFKAGFAHFTNNEGKEDKHMFWWLFEARQDPENAPVVLFMGGGPGASGLLFPFSGAGPCKIQPGKDGQGETVPSPYSFTDHVNMLAIDHPVGVGFSYGDPGALRNSSERAAWDVDDFLQSFWRRYPRLAKNQFMISSGSYGGTYIPHIINTILTRNVAAAAVHPRGSLLSHKRIVKMPESIVMGNVWSDALTRYRWQHKSTCFDNPFYNQTVCNDIASALPGCLDAIQFAYEQPSIENKFEATEACGAVNAPFDRDPYDFRRKCSKGDCDMKFDFIENVMNGPGIKDAVGVPRSQRFSVINTEDIHLPFVMNGDMIQASYLLLAPAIDAGLRMLVYNGMADGIAPWRASLAWMRLLKTKHQSTFRTSPEVAYPGFGYIQKAGMGPSGEYTLVKVREAGHMVILSQPELLRHLLVQWLRNEPFFEE